MPETEKDPHFPTKPERLEQVKDRAKLRERLGDTAMDQLIDRLGPLPEKHE